jgi:hypothetical protein
LGKGGDKKIPCRNQEFFGPAIENFPAAHDIPVPVADTASQQGLIAWIR